MIDALVKLGSKNDARRKLPNRPLTPWADGDEPHGHTLDLNEYPVELLKLKKCRSFRADLRHKLTLIIRARGGYGWGGLESTAKALGVSRWSILRWLRWDTCPRAVQLFSKIDNLYADSLEKLVAEKIKKKK